MEISVDGNRRDVSEQPATMGKLISRIKNDVLAGGRIVLAIEVDGHAVDADYEREIHDRPVGDFRKVSVETADPKTLCLATLEEVSHHIAPIIDESARISDLVDTGKDTQAFARIVPCIEVWGAIVKAVHDIAALMQVEMDQVATNDESLSESLRALVELLQRIKDSMEARDLVGVRDAMKHEMPEVADRIAAQLEALSSLVAAK